MLFKRCLDVLLRVGRFLGLVILFFWGMITNFCLAGPQNPSPGFDGNKSNLLSSESFNFGIEYSFITRQIDAYKISDKYKDIGATWCKFNGHYTFWEDIEPEAPKNGKHCYTWEKIDAAIAFLQRSGFVNLQIVIGPKSSWGCEPNTQKGLLSSLKNKNACTPPKEEHLKDYIEWVYAFVEL